MDCSSPNSSVHSILQARILEWLAIPFSRDLPDAEIKPGCPALQANSLLSEPQGKPVRDLNKINKVLDKMAGATKEAKDS